jgi:hypothetical protein
MAKTVTVCITDGAKHEFKLDDAAIEIFKSKVWIQGICVTVSEGKKELISPFRITTIYIIENK